jgi:hypothetical protein
MQIIDNNMLKQAGSQKLEYFYNHEQDKIVLQP